MNKIQKMIKSGSITMEESETIKSDAEQALIAAKIANADRVKPIRIDDRTTIFVKANEDNALEKYLEKRKKDSLLQSRLVM